MIVTLNIVYLVAHEIQHEVNLFMNHLFPIL